MGLSPAQEQLRDRLFQAMLEATFPFKPGTDPEVTLEMLLAATELLKQHFEHELEEIRVEQAD